MLQLDCPVVGGRVLLHSCCAPCSAAVIECMLYNGIRPTVFFYNPNIYPYDEYCHRKYEAQRFVTAQGLTFIDADYDYGSWREAVRGCEGSPERGPRCALCFLHRLSVAARYASVEGYAVVATTLASSRWKDLTQVNSAGLTACAPYPTVTFWQQNWRKGGLQERRSALLREHNFYNQQYCGCEFSLSKSDTSR